MKFPHQLRRLGAKLEGYNDGDKRAVGSYETSMNIYLTMNTKAQRLINFIIPCELHKYLEGKCISFENYIVRVKVLSLLYKSHIPANQTKRNIPICNLKAMFSYKCCLPHVIQQTEVTTPGEMNGYFQLCTNVLYIYIYIYIYICVCPSFLSRNIGFL